MPRKSAENGEVCTIHRTVRTTPSVAEELRRLCEVSAFEGDGVDRGHDGSHKMTPCYLIHVILEDVLGTRKNGALEWVLEEIKNASK